MGIIWVYVILMCLVTIFTVYESIGYYREYTQGKEKKDMIRFIIKILVLIILVALLIQLINWALTMPEFMGA